MDDSGTFEGLGEATVVGSGTDEGPSATLLAAREQAPSSTVGRFVVVAPIGEGAMGAVYRAYDPKLRREVAVKVLKDASGSNERGRVLREAQALAQLNHPNVVSIYDAGESDRGVYIAMEYVVGVDLRTWMETTRPWREVLDVAMQAGRGLAAAHAVGLIHRDFKPANVLVGDDGRARVLDFGLARASDDADVSAALSHPPDDLSISASDASFGAALSQELTAVGTVMGTPAYMAPEQHFGRPADARADQFAFCVTLWEALAGQRPYLGGSLSALAKAKRRTAKIPKGATPRWVFDVLVRGLAPKVEERWPSMDALLDALGRDPTRARRRLIVGGAFTLAMTGVALGTVFAHRQRVAACEAQGAQIELVWSEERATAVHEAFVATGLPHAPVTFENLRPWLDAYAAGWSALRTEACLGEARTGGTTERFETAARACLDLRRDDFAAFIDVLEDADAMSIAASVESAAALPKLDPCLDRVWLERQPAPPSTPRERETASEVRRRLARTRALMLAGRAGPALDEGRAAAQLADQLDYGPVQLEARLVLADAEFGAGDVHEARDDAERAFMQALRIDADEAALDAASVLVHYEGAVLANTAGGRRWAEVASALLDRVEARGTLREADLETRMGRFAFSLSDLDGALAHHRAAYALRNEVLPADHPQLGASLRALGGVFDARGEYAKAIEVLDRALTICKATMGDEHPCVANHALARGRVDEGLGDYAAAEEHYQRALDILSRTYDPNHPLLANPLRALGLVRLAQGRYDEARAYYERMLAIDEAAFGPDHPDVAAALNSLGFLAFVELDFEGAKPHFERAVEIYERFGVEHREFARVLTNLGVVEEHLEHFDRALELERRALAMFEARLGPSHPDVAWTLTRIGHAHRGRGDHAVAVRAYTRALEQWDTFGGPPGEEGETRFGLGWCLLELGREPERAFALLEQARGDFERSSPAYRPVIERIDARLALRE